MDNFRCSFDHTDEVLNCRMLVGSGNVEDPKRKINFTTSRTELKAMLNEWYLATGESIDGTLL